jgi:hypothetical protein
MLDLRSSRRRYSSADVAAREALLVERGTIIGPEVDDQEPLDFPAEVVDVVLTNRSLVDKPLQKIAASAASPSRRYGFSIPLG